jgi:N-acetylglucosamine-1-phosphodiester alpha-N-acetylglucosaminidase
VLPDGQRTNAYLGVSANPVGHFAIAPAPGSQFNGSEFQCAVAPTNVTALANGCVLATNGGFFSLKTGQCIGDLVHKGVVLQSDSTATRASFGITAKGQWVAGYLSEHDLGSLDLQELITGVGWLVRNGKSFVNESVEIEGIDEGFVREIAPRTGIGFDAVGRLMLLEVDGEEDIKLGMDLWQFADLFLSLGAFSAVNIDGGGSSAVFFNGSVVDTPTCNDTAEVCVRPVTTITCVF